jgi:hypothetical protein
MVHFVLLPIRVYTMCGDSNIKISTYLKHVLEEQKYRFLDLTESDIMHGEGKF